MQPKPWKQEIDENERRIDALEDDVEVCEDSSADFSQLGKEGIENLKPIDNNSVIGMRVYNKLNIDYLIKDSFMDIRFIFDNKNGHQ